MNEAQSKVIGNCRFRHENGNCLAVGGCCPAVTTPICEALEAAYQKGLAHGHLEFLNRGEYDRGYNAGWVDCLNEYTEKGLIY